MPNIGWNESSPADGDSAGLGDDHFRSLKSSIRVGLDGEHIWPSGGGDAGAHRLGTARPYVGAQSLVSSAGTDGKVMWASDSSRFFHVGSGGTALVGGPTVLSVGSFPGAIPQRHYWAVEMGRHFTVSGATVVNFPNSGFSGIPFFTATARQAQENPTGGSLGFVVAGNQDATNTSINVYSYSTTGASISIGFDWISIGTRVL